ncbi:HNH endonuclease [bacterium]|nr:HNH endonuclease [bacterium]
MIRFDFYVHEEGCDFCFHRDNLRDFSESTKSMLLKFSKCVSCGNNIKKDFSPCECATKDSDKDLQLALRYFMRSYECITKDSDKDWVTGYRMTKEQLDHIWPYIQKDRRRAYGKKGRAIRRKRLSEAGGYPADEDIYRLWELQNRECYFCWEPLWVPFPILGETRLLHSRELYQVEHLTPPLKGGTNWPYNIALACKKCNRCKSDKNEASFWRLLEKEHGEKWVSEHKSRATKNRGAKRKLTNIKKKELERKRQKSCNRGKISNGSDRR